MSNGIVMWYIIIICIIHYFILNPFEKLYFSYNLDHTNRPLDKCIDQKYNGCYGFPSGHAEIITIICAYLLFNKMISVPIAILLIIIVCAQRLITNMHTLDQVIYGTCFGFIYSYLYWVTQFSIYSLVISFTFMVILTILIHYHILEFLNEPIPNWVDPEMYDIMDEKKHKNIFIQISSIFKYLKGNMKCMFGHWNEVEDLLDRAIVKIKESGIQYDGIVGIKTGGAIVSDYISKKLNIKNYKIKVINKKKKIDDELNALIAKMMNKDDYAVDADIDQHILNKNIILIDESIYTGVTMDVAIDYLKPKVNHLYPIVLVGNGTILNGVHNVEIIDYHPLIVWPWGYDN